jgi:hypothetical protein
VGPSGIIFISDFVKMRNMVHTLKGTYAVSEKITDEN